MNFISGTEGGETRVELKYCERCGGLWLRARGRQQVHCGGCHARLTAMLERSEERLGRGPRRQREEQIQAAAEFGIPGCIDQLQGVAAVEVRA